MHSGVRSARLLTWQERLAALRDLVLWDHALCLGLQIYKAASPPTAVEASQTAASADELLVLQPFKTLNGMQTFRKQRTVRQQGEALLLIQDAVSLLFAGA